MAELRDALPALYRDLLGPPLDRDVPAEEKATCASCAMLEGACGAVPSVDGRPHAFRADTKCCTFHPRLPGYLVGALLDDPEPGVAEGRRRIEARLASRVGVTPGWIHPPRAYALLYDGARGAFGRARGLRCPYYAEGEGSCTIWRHREAVCSTYFCRYVAGADGRALWTAVKEYLSLVEIQLVRASLLAIAPELLDGELERGTRAGPPGPEDLDGAPPPAAEYAAAWGGWSGREAELYRACHRHVAALSAAELDALLGLDGILARRKIARAADAATSGALPPVLRLDPGATVAWLPDGSVALAAYSPLEAVALPGEAYRLLARFTGDAPVEAVRARLRAEERADLADEVLLELYRHRVLAPPPGGAGAAAASPASDAGPAGPHEG
jgi:Fe-S-cluster containining protein